MNNPRKLKKVVIRENLVALTGGWLKALILNQFIYWSERSKDTDDFLLEEKKRSEKDGIEMDIPLTYGWIYKTAIELNDELMVNVHRTTMRKMLSELVGKGWLDERTNPKYKWDRTLQYRPNIVKIQTDLAALGYVLDGYPLQCHLNDIRMSSIRQSKERTPTFKGAQTDIQKSVSRHAIPEITTEITTEIKCTPTKVSSPKENVKKIETYDLDHDKLKEIATKKRVHGDWIAILIEEFLEHWKERKDKLAFKTEKGWYMAFGTWCMRTSSKCLYAAPPGEQSQNENDIAEKNRLIREENKRIDKMYRGDEHDDE